MPGRWLVVSLGAPPKRDSEQRPYRSAQWRRTLDVLVALTILRTQTRIPWKVPRSQSAALELGRWRYLRWQAPQRMHLPRSLAGGKGWTNCTRRRAPSTRRSRLRSRLASRSTSSMSIPCERCTAVLNGLLAPFLLVGILIVASDATLMAGQLSSRLGRSMVAITTVAMFGAAIGMFIF